MSRLAETMTQHLRNTTRQLAELQSKLISSGSKTAQDVLDTNIIEAEYESKEENS